MSMRCMWAEVALGMAMVAGVYPSAHAQKYKILHAFPSSSADGGGLWGKVAFDNLGNLYGMTMSGGEYDYGTIYQLTPSRSGVWTESIVHNFNQTDPLGADPAGWVVLDGVGNLYGGTPHGGAGYGSVFELSPDGSGGWTESVLYSVEGPYGGLALDKAGNLFGNAGGVFEVSPGSNGWTENTLCATENCISLGGVIVDSLGNIYGTAGGAYDDGDVYQVSKRQGVWGVKLLHSFRGAPDGDGFMFGQLAMDSSGNLYGVTGGGGTNKCQSGLYDCGVIYELLPQPGGHWKETILYDFQYNSTGYSPSGGVVLDNAGNIYGTTGYGGGPSDCGVIYKLAPGTGGTWTYTVLHTFSGTDGCLSEANMIFDNHGHLYGTTTGGGPNGSGVVFEIIP